MNDINYIKDIMDKNHETIAHFVWSIDMFEKQGYQDSILQTKQYIENIRQINEEFLELAKVDRLMGTDEENVEIRNYILNKEKEK